VRFVSSEYRVLHAYEEEIVLNLVSKFPVLDPHVLKYLWS